jgi:type VI protein secretion system component VasF
MNATRTTPVWPFFACAHIFVGVALLVGIVLFVKQTDELNAQLRALKSALLDVDAVGPTGLGRG